MRRLLPAADGAAPTLDDDALTAAYELPAGVSRHVRMNFVTSADGAVTVKEKSGGLSNPADREVFGTLRDLADLVLVGAGTARVEGYHAALYGPDRRARRSALGRPELPVIAVVSRSLDLDPTWDLFTSAEPGARTAVITHRTAPPDRLLALGEVADIVLAGDEGRVDLAAALDQFAERGLTRVLCEGGPTLFDALLETGLVDELCLTLSPLIAGPGTGRIIAGPVLDAAPYPLRLLHLLEHDGVLLLRYAVARDMMEQ